MLDTTEVFDCITEQWSRSPPMVQERYCHSTCELANYIYAFGGRSYQLSCNLASVERVNLQKFLNGHKRESWEEVPYQGGQNLRPRTGAVFSPISPTELVILGGGMVNESEMYGDGFVLDLKRGEMRKVVEERPAGYGFHSWPQSYHVANTGTVCALVKDRYKTLSFITYTRGDSDIKVPPGGSALEYECTSKYNEKTREEYK